ncbi:MAG: RNA-guided endonuclease InsQ/TnpB family protein [Nitrosotalea sp.]
MIYDIDIWLHNKQVLYKMRKIHNYRFRLYPNSVIKSRLGATLEASRWLYNYLLSKNIQSKEDMQFALTDLKENEQWLKLYHSKMLQMIPHRIDSARRSLLEKKKRGYDIGQVQYAKRDEWNTFVYNQSGFKIEKHGNSDLLWLSKIGWMEIRLHRPTDGNIKQVTITKKAGKWFAIIAMEVQPSLLKLIDLTKSVGIDVGIKNYAYDSDGSVTPNPQNLLKMLKPLARAQRKMSRRVKGSCNYKKAKRWYQIVHERIVNRRGDFQHKLSAHYAKKFDVVFMENLPLTNMIKNHHLAQKIMDAAWGSFKNMIKYKGMVIDVESKNTTIDCSRCGNKVPKTLAIRIHQCDQCGLLIDRDHNASLNILKRGLELWNLPMEHREVTPVEISLRSEKQEKVLSTRVG